MREYTLTYLSKAVLGSHISSSEVDLSLSLAALAAWVAKSSAPESSVEFSAGRGSVEIIS